MEDDFKKTHEAFELPKEDLEALFESTFTKMNDDVPSNPEAEEVGKAPEYAPKTPDNEPYFEEDIRPPNSEARVAAGSLRHPEVKAEGSPSNFEELKKEVDQVIENISPGTVTANPKQNIRRPERSEGSPRKKTTLRQRYEDEAKRIVTEIGDIEAIRMKIGLSKRKVCQLLMIDPSAWTRWTKGQAAVPPHIYRSLQWYMLLQDKHPEYRSSMWLNTVASPSISEKEMDALQLKLIEGSKNQITKKAINYLAEEDHKRNKLEKIIDDKVHRIEQFRNLVYVLVATQTIILLGLIIQWL